MSEAFRPTMDHTAFLLNFYEVRPGARVGQKNQAFRYRTAIWMNAQKSGKSPGMAAHVLLEFLGPVLFDGWAAEGEFYACADHGCPCGWVYAYEEGEPKGRPWPSPLIQLAALSEEQVGNTWKALLPMIDFGPLKALLRTGEEFIRHPNGNSGSRIEVVTSKARTKLGARITFALCDETGLWTSATKMVEFMETLGRGLGGMQGRLVQSTNPYNPAEDSVAQRTHESSLTDVYKHYFPPPVEWSFRNKRERRKIFAWNYASAPWTDLDSIEAEAVALMEKNPGDAERYFGNRIVAGSRVWLPHGAWEKKTASVEVAPRTKICLGFDGSETNDLSGIRAETLDFFQFTPTYHKGERLTIWDPRQWGGRVPRFEVEAAWDDIFNEYDVVRVYCDPYRFETDLDTWKARYGEKVFFEWWTNRISQMHASLERFKTDVTDTDSPFSHDGCPTTTIHMRNAVEKAQRGQRYTIAKASEGQKIDLAMSSVLAHEAAADAVASGASSTTEEYVYF